MPVGVLRFLMGLIESDVCRDILSECWVLRGFRLIDGNLRDKATAICIIWSVFGAKQYNGIFSLTGSFAKLEIC